MKRSGNGYTGRQDLYIMTHREITVIVFAGCAYLALVYHPALIWLFLANPVKIGIGGNSEKRRAQVDKSVPGRVVRLVSLRVRGAYQIEQSLHRALHPFRVPFIGSGKTEWFAGFTAFPAIVVAALAWTWERGIFFALVVALVWWLVG